MVISTTHNDALEAFENMIINQQFGEASSKVIIEEFLEGIEVSIFVLTNGIDYQIIGHNVKHFSDREVVLACLRGTA